MIFKKSLLLLVITASLTVSCKKDKTTTLSKDELIKGTWNLDNLNNLTNVKLVQEGQLQLETEVKTVSSEENFTLSFQEDKTYKASGNLNLNITTKDSSFVQVVTDSLTTGTWSITDNTLTLISGTDTTNNEIQTLTENALSFKSEIEESVFSDFLGLDVVVNVKESNKYKK